MGNSLYDLSATAGSNTSIDGNGIAGNSARSLGDNVIRSLAAFLKRFVYSLGGAATAAGTDTYTLTITEDWSAYAHGMIVAAKFTNANTGAATLNITPASAVALGAKKIRRQGDTALNAGDIVAGGTYLFQYDSAFDSAAGAFKLLNPSITLGANLVSASGSLKALEVWGGAISDETTAITTGNGKLSFAIPYAFTVVGVYASLNTVSSSGTPTFDINEAGTTILSTKIVIDVSEKTGGSAGYQGTAAGAAVISDTSIAANAEITVDIDVAGTGAKGAKVFIIGYPT